MPAIKHVKKTGIVRKYTTSSNPPRSSRRPHKAPIAFNNAFIHPPTALLESQTLHDGDQPQNGHQLGSIEHSIKGRHIAVKDNICTIDSPTTCASNILQDFQSPFDATVVKKLKDLGAHVSGKTNMDEFGMGSHSTHSNVGWVKNRGPDGNFNRSAGGSSGGSAVAVAEDNCWV
jgi:aspartyl-tRNA(Asn)/glutamyl-tRNA(Gln) amidotransferase subunit A